MDSGVMANVEWWLQDQLKSSVLGYRGSIDVFLYGSSQEIVFKARYHIHSVIHIGFGDLITIMGDMTIRYV
ncbi:Hypothetical predicted protein [Octopus vulgaris]|uniref:Uncharacterized protein n=1 Tax=Octopus vulgaris TaxID=6645 RepID=A0AA36FDN7_OCTVU|nr:Hypothetical predicted protein [Octopus vulgaris]